MGRPKGSKNKTTKAVKSVVQLNEDDKILYRKLTDYLQEVYLQTVPGRNRARYRLHDAGADRP